MLLILFIVISEKIEIASVTNGDRGRDSPRGIIARDVGFLRGIVRSLHSHSVEVPRRTSSEIALRIFSTATDPSSLIALCREFLLVFFRSSSRTGKN